MKNSKIPNPIYRKIFPPDTDFFFISALYSVFCLILILSGCTEGDRMYRESRLMMDTFCSITVVSSSKEKAKEAIEAGFKEIEKLERLLNYYSPESEVAAINRASGDNPVKVSQETFEIIRKAVEIARYTHGAFDPTIGPLMRLWGFSKETINPSIPSQDEIKNAVRLVDYKKIKINESVSEIFLAEKDMELDLGGIAKGYAADKAIESIKAKGVRASLVAVGGDIKTFGIKPDNRPWKVGVQNPRADFNNQKAGEDIFLSLSLSDKAISTSGDYQRFVVVNGKRYHHIINPGTGFPASAVMSVSVISSEGYIADGLSTAVFILGSVKGMELLESMGLDGIIVDEKEEILITEQLKEKVNIEKTL